METNLLDRMLDAYQSEQKTVTVTLQNKIRVTGRIKAFDSYVIVLENQKREILYRHAVSCLAAHAPEEQKRPAPAFKPRPVQTKPAAMPVKPSVKKPVQRQPQTALSGTAGETGLSNSMKEGLLKWMQEQKAAK